MKNHIALQVIEARVRTVKAADGESLPIDASAHQGGMLVRILRLFVVLFLFLQVGHALATDPVIAEKPGQQLKSFKAIQAALLQNVLSLLPSDKAPSKLKTFMALHFIQYDRKDLMEELFNWGMNPNEQLSYRQPHILIINPLLFTTAKGGGLLLQFWMQKTNPLLFAAAQESADMFRFFLQEELYRRPKDEPILTITPLAFATVQGSEDMLRFLVEQGADLEQRSMGMTPLSLVLCDGKYTKAELLLDLGAKPTSMPMIAGLMLDLGAEPIALDTDYTYLMQLVGCPAPEEKNKEAYERLIKRLVDAGADINAQDNQGLTVLSHAVIGMNVNDVEILLQLGANPNIKSNTGKTALDVSYILRDNKRASAVGSKASVEKIIQLLEAARKS